MDATRRVPTAPLGRSMPKRIGHAIGRGFVAALLTGYAIVSVYPFLWMFSGAFKDNREILSNPLPWPKHPTLSTIVSVWNAMDIPNYLKNSAFISVVTVLLIVVIYPLAGYAFAVMRFPGRDVLFVLFLAIIFVPGIVILLPLVVLVTKLGLIATPWAVILPAVNGAAPLALVISRTYFRSVPPELRDAAKIDGASEWRTYWTIFFPLARPAVVTIALLNFVGIWNEYVLAKLLLGSERNQVLPVGLQLLMSTNVVNWNEVAAGAALVVLPVIVLFVVFQRYFINGIIGGVKA